MTGASLSVLLCCGHALRVQVVSENAVLYIYICMSIYLYLIQPQSSRDKRSLLSGNSDHTAMNMQYFRTENERASERTSERERDSEKVCVFYVVFYVRS